ncbi:hypothetical protein [Helicobacter anatolicus]|uniref:hypothetical protein n=1 Tax=Helicobacter anatolicus TaxID=2905874 RepID=UPI001E5D1DCC|nr:hypothetical protein [Helicobacter anatolicus]MCE3037769.1 hypothetical protein [Helicobacter anatolicus]
MIFTTKELGELLSLTERHIYNLEKQGILKKENKNEWDAPKNIKAYIEYKLENEGKTSDYGKIKARRELADAKLKELTLKEKQGELIHITTIAKELEDIAVTISNKLYALPHTIKSQTKITKETEKLLNIEVEKILNELKDPREYEIKANLFLEKQALEKEGIEDDKEIKEED